VENLRKKVAVSSISCSAFWRRSVGPVNIPAVLRVLRPVPHVPRLRGSIVDVIVQAASASSLPN
jgi:hypothetical protein